MVTTTKACFSGNLAGVESEAIESECSNRVFFELYKLQNLPSIHKFSNVCGDANRRGNSGISSHWTLVDNKPWMAFISQSSACLSLNFRAKINLL